MSKQDKGYGLQGKFLVCSKLIFSYCAFLSCDISMDMVIKINKLDNFGWWVKKQIRTDMKMKCYKAIVLLNLTYAKWSMMITRQGSSTHK